MTQHGICGQGGVSARGGGAPVPGGPWTRKTPACSFSTVASWSLLQRTLYVASDMARDMGRGGSEPGGTSSSAAVLALQKSEYLQRCHMLALPATCSWKCPFHCPETRAAVTLHCCKGW